MLFIDLDEVFLRGFPCPSAWLRWLSQDRRLLLERSGSSQEPTPHKLAKVLVGEVSLGHGGCTERAGVCRQDPGTQPEHCRSPREAPTGPTGHRLSSARARGVRLAAALTLGFKRVENVNTQDAGEAGEGPRALHSPFPELSPMAKRHWDFCSLLRRLTKQSVTLECWQTMGHFLLQISYDLLGTGYNHAGR